VIAGIVGYNPARDIDECLPYETVHFCLEFFLGTHTTGGHCWNTLLQQLEQRSLLEHAVTQEWGPTPLLEHVVPIVRIEVIVGITKGTEVIVGS
jgi:hypothetical protein